MTIKKILVSIIILLLFAGTAQAVPETVSMRITDVTPSSFSVVWMTDVTAEPTVEVFADSSMTTDVTGMVDVMPMHGASAAVVEAARVRGIMKVCVTGLSADSTYFVRTVTKDPAIPGSVGYSALAEVRTAALVVPYKTESDGTLRNFSNDLLSFGVYIRPMDTDSVAIGNLLILEPDGSSYPVSAFVGEGDGTNLTTGVLDLNNIFSDSVTQSLNIAGGERSQIRVYRGGTLSTLLHYRLLPIDEELVNVLKPVRGFFADINLDADIDEVDFNEFRNYYRLLDNDGAYNPDFNFVINSTNRIDVMDFSRFAAEFGRTDVK